MTIRYTKGSNGFPPSGEGGFSNLLSGISAPGVQGYSYSFDANTGNLTSRTNSLRTKTDTFGYDTEKLDRLTSVTGSASPTVSVTYTTDKSGNIQTKSDAGTYVYDATQPYAVDQITNGLNIATASQTVSYYSFEKVKDITEGTKRAEFIYNADQQRIRMVLKTSETTTRTKYYFGGSCEREVANGVTTQYIWIGGDAYTAVAVAKKVGTGSWTVSNIFRDHLGTITHLKGSTTDEYSFDAWGRRRDKDDWTYTLTSEPALFADRGFTGHEYLEDFKLYNMNGRLYDPVVGRFLSPDPVVQDPSFTQSLNRYSYCLNNPLKFTDPTGNKWNWNWLNPLYWFSEGMQTINDNTKQLRQNMAKAGIPSFSIGTSVSFAGDINFNASYRGQEVFNSEYIDRSDAEIKVEKEIARVNNRYGDEWRGKDSGQTNWGLYFTGALLTVEDVYNNFGHNHSTYLTTKGVEMPIYKSNGMVRSARAAQFARSSNLVKTLGTAGSALMTGVAVYNIRSGNGTALDYGDATVGAVGTVSGAAELLGLGSIPVVGQGVALYSWSRLWFDIGSQYGPSTWYGPDNTKWFK